MILLKFISPSKNFHSQSKTTSFGRPDTKIDFWPEPELGPIKSLQIPLKELLNSDEPDQCFCSNRNFRSLIAGLKIGYLPVSSSHQIAVNLSM